MAVSDSELVQQAQQNSMSAYRELVNRYKKKIYFTALGILKSHHDAEDVLQDSLVQGLKSLKKLKQPGGFGSWITRIAYNRSIDIIRKRKKEIQAGDDEEGSSIFDSMVNYSSESNPHQGVHSKQIRKAIVAVMEGLPDSQRRAFELKHISNLTIKEIAEITDSSESTVKTNIFRAVQKMRDALADYIERKSGNAIDTQPEITH